ncbi:hypothetical protein [Nonomuraea aurantiaca]|uniref:hypothetical protein n=1 Tax=Nonomuraea aurantiaca TaxID=2878562 RepID=UPI001CD95C9E|nr:hypothetical protein [Nonomuraea aurantiaca]MCA2228716.1 hypothetical protein [Nonomuraea aurantiaca]
MDSGSFDVQEQFVRLWQLGLGLTDLGENVAVDLPRGKCPVLLVIYQPFPLRIRAKLYKGERVFAWGWMPWCRIPVLEDTAVSAERLLKLVAR